MDTSDPEITFDENGICNHCVRAEKLLKEHVYISDKEERLNKILSEIRERGKDSEYDCVIGVSGGVDSTYLAYHIVREFGLRPLAVHLDNGWNSELSVMNVENTLKKLNLDLITKVMDWEEFRDIQLSFIKASVPHCEHPTDHAILATLRSVAKKYKIPYLLLGSNLSTESYGVKSWSIGQRDWKYIKGIQKKFGSKKIKDFPHTSAFDILYYKYFFPIKSVNILDFIEYNKKDAKETIMKELGWRDYGGKHYESIFTKFFQTYILPVKFGIDKRRIHLSPLIITNQITREEALKELEKNPCSEQELNWDKEYISKKFGISIEAFDALMAEEVKSFWDYKSYENNWWFKYLKPIFSRKYGK